MRRTFFSVTVSIIFTAMNAFSAERFHVGIIQDGRVQHELIPREMLQEEVRVLLGRDRDLHFPEVRYADWTFEGAAQLLDEMQQDQKLDAVVTLGLLGSSAAAQKADLRMPTVSVLVGDSKAQSFPRQGRGSGKRNFVYVDDTAGIEDEIRTFHDVTGFKRLAVVADAAWLKALPELIQLANATATRLGVEISFVPAQDSAQQVIDQLPAEVDAVYVGWLLRFPPDQLSALAEALIEKNLLSFSAGGRPHVEAGIMMTAAADTRVSSIVRRTAIVLQRIALGEAPDQIPVNLVRPKRLAFNLATAQKLNFSPRWEFLESADLIESQAVDGQPIKFLQAIDEALLANKELLASRYDPQIAETDVHLARATLLPQIALGVNATRVDSSRAETFDLAADSSDGEVLASQLIYSERAYADLAISKQLARASYHRVDARELDTIEEAAVAYFQLLRAHGSRDIQQENLDLSRENLDLANTRLRVGYSNRSDVLRWESRVSGETAAVYQAQAGFEQAQTALAQLLGRPFDKPVVPVEGDAGPILAFINSPDVQDFIGDPLSWQKVKSFYMDIALSNSPELMAIDDEIAGLERDKRASKREYFIPEITFEGYYGKNFDRSGAGAETLDQTLSDSQWVIGLNARLPLTTGGARRAQVSRASMALLRAQAGRAAFVEQIEASVMAAVQSSGGSYPSIELTASSAAHAEAHMALVQDQYSKGATDVTALIDAQDAMLEARLAEVNARYAFLIDLVGLLRAAGDFSLLLAESGQQDWIEQVTGYHRDAAGKDSIQRRSNP